MQLDQALRLIEGRGTVVAEYFDINVSRSRPWGQRAEASRLLEEMNAPGRPWDALVVGAADRAWHGSQFSTLAPTFEHHRVDIWIPELGGKYDAANVGHELQLSISGSLSKAEREKTKARVRQSMASQVRDSGRWQGGRPPYGYRVVDDGPHSKATLAARGVTAKKLVIDEETAPIVARIFREYAAGGSLRGIARRLDGEGIPTPSAAHPEATNHAPAATWSAGTLSGILRNARVTGYEHWGLTKRVEAFTNLQNPGDGYEIRHVPSEELVVRSTAQTHPAIIPLGEFSKVQQLLKGRAASGGKVERAVNRQVKSTYIFRGLIRCAICGRRMEGTRRSVKSPESKYRCVVRPDDEMIEGHLKAIYIRESAVMDVLRPWLSELFKPANRKTTAAALGRVQTEEDAVASQRFKRTQAKLTDARTRLQRLFALVEAGAEATDIAPELGRSRLKFEPRKRKRRDWRPRRHAKEWTCWPSSTRSVAHSMRSSTPMTVTSSPR